MKAGDLARIIGGKLTGEPEAEVSGFSTDSRLIKPGQVFVALKGRHHDGHDFIPDAFRRGAVGVISAIDTRPPPGRFVLKVKAPLEALQKIAAYRRKSFGGTLIGVTGSVGKTTTKELIAYLLSLTAPTYRSEGNLNSQIGLPLVLSNMDTGARYAVVELGASRRGDIRRLTEIACPRIRVLTAVGEEHLETFGSLKDVVEGNGEIFHRFGEEDRAVIPSRLRGHYRLPPDRTLTFGEGGDLRADLVRFSLEGILFRFAGEDFLLPVLSRGAVENALASFCVLSLLGYDPREFREELTGFSPPPGRMNLLRFGDFYLIDDTYNANPPSVRNAVETLCALPAPSGRIFVLGDMLELGEESERLHREVGAFMAESGLDFAIFYGNEARHAFEEFRRRGGKGVFTREKEDALEEMLKWMGDENIILLKGSRGMRMEALVDKVRELTGYES